MLRMNDIENQLNKRIEIISKELSITKIIITFLHNNINNTTNLKVVTFKTQLYHVNTNERDNVYQQNYGLK